MCSLVGLVDMAASEAVNALPVCVYTVHRYLRWYPWYLYPVICDQILHEEMESQVDHDQEVNDRCLLLDRYGHDPYPQSRLFQEIDVWEVVVCPVTSLWDNLENQIHQMWQQMKSLPFF